MSAAGQALKAAASSAKSHYARQKELERLRRTWVVGTEMTAAQLADEQARLREEFYQRLARRAA